MDVLGRVRSSFPSAIQVEPAHHLGVYAHLLFSAHAAHLVSLQGRGALTLEGRASVGAVSLSGVDPAWLHDF